MIDRDKQGQTIGDALTRTKLPERLPLDSDEVLELGFCLGFCQITGIELIVFALCRDKLVMIAPLNDPSLL